MICADMEDKLAGYLLQTLTHHETALMKTHLEACAACKKMVARAQKVKELLDAWMPANPPSDLKNTIIATLRAQHTSDKTIAAMSQADAVSSDDLFEILRKMVGSEQLRVYKFLTEFFGKELGEKAFEYYLQEQMNMRLSTPAGEVLAYADVIAKSLGGQVTMTRNDEEIKSESVEQCPYMSLAKEMGMQGSPCETICRRQMDAVEKFKSIKIERIKLFPGKDGSCIFLSRPAGQKPSE